MTLNKCHTRQFSLGTITLFFSYFSYFSLLLADATHSGVKSSLASIMLLLPLLVFFPFLLNLMFAMQIDLQQAIFFPVTLSAIPSITCGQRNIHHPW